MAVITNANAAGTESNPKDNIPNTQNPQSRTAKTHRNTPLAHPPGFQYQIASNARPVKTTGTNMRSSTHRSLASTKEADNSVTIGTSSLPAGTA
jgi:hypothetical protein